MQISFTNMLAIAGALLGSVFLVVSLRGSRTLIGSFFKNYYWLMVVGAVALIFGFLIRPVGEMVGMDGQTVMVLHDIALLIESVLFVYAGYVLPNDVRKYLRWNEKHTK